MKRYISMILAVLLIVCMVSAIPKVNAAGKTTESRAIAIVFDNSGSMYEEKNMAWCRATYAMEVFASMLNKGDVLQIYPMWPIQVGGKTYTMEAPFQVTDAAQASTIRDIFTANASGTPIESIDCAASGLQKVQADKKYMIVLTDGGTFSKNSSGLSKDRTRKELDNRVTQYAGKSMSVMYLGIGADACMPNTAESEWFVKKQAVNTADVLSTLTYMCNQIFGRDTLPKSRINGNTIDVDISISKMIIFVQGENISNLKLTGGTVGQQVSSQQTMYSTKGAGDYKSVPDTSLQGMMVTYTDCAAGTYNIEYTGTASSVEVYYEPDADLDFVFTDAEGNTVDPNALYEGDYKVTFGMKDAKTGKLISSDLLGNPKYQGSYFIDGKETPFTHEGFSGSVDVPLKMGEKFEAKLTATYLSGYTITKDSSDFGWPEGGIQVAPKPAGEMKLEISGGAGTYSLLHLEDDEPAVAKVYYQGTQLTGSELNKVDLRWDSETSNAEIKKTFADDHWKLSLHYKDPAAPQNTVCGECTVTIYAHYSPPGSSEAQTQCAFTYNIKDDFIPLKLELDVPETYIVIKELEESAPITVNFKLNGAPLSAEDFSRVVPQVDCSGIKHTVTPDEQSRSYTIKLLATEGIAEGNYPIKVTAQYTDQVGRETQVSESVTITLSNISLLAKTLLYIVGFLVVVAIAIVISRIPAMPKHVSTPPRRSSLTIGATTFDKGVSFPGNRSGKTLKVLCHKGGMRCGLTMKVSPGDGSFISTPQKSRSMVVKPQDVSLQAGGARITEASINGIRFGIDPQTRKFGPVKQNTKPIQLKNNTAIKFSGTIMENGRPRAFSVKTNLEFKTKK